MQETRVRSLGREGPLDKEMATHSSIHAWKIQWTEEPGGLQSMGLQRVGHDWATSLLHFSLLFFFNSRKALANSPSSCLTQLEEFGQWTQNTKERSHTHAHRLRSKENKEAVYLGQKYNLHTQRRRVPKHLTLRSTQQGSRSPTPTFISFSVLWMGGGLFFFFFEVQFLYNIVQQSFWLGWNIHRGEGWGVAWIAPGRISFWSWALVCLPKSLSIGFKSCFPWRFPLLVEHHIRRVLQGCHQQPVPFSCTCSMFYAQSFLLTCYHISLLDAIPLCHGLLKCKARSGLAFCLMPICEEGGLGLSCPDFPAS